MTDTVNINEKIIEKLAPNTTDMGNAMRLAIRYGQSIRYCHVWKKWLIWDKKRWVIDPSGAIMRCAKNTVRGIYSEASDTANDEERKTLAKHALRSESESKLRAMVSLTESEPGIPIQPEQLDINLWLLNALNGTINLQTGKLQEHHKEDYITKLISAEYEPSAPCPTWLNFLDEIMDGNKEIITFLQRAVGYSLTGSTKEQVMFILHGTGQNGKSTFIDTISSLLGEYAQQTPTDTLMFKNSSGIPNDIARLKGSRFVAAVESEEGHRLAEVLVKQLTGGDKITARFLHAEFFEFKPQFKLWLATNHKPLIRGTDHAIWRRIRLIPFLVTIPPEKIDKDLPNKLIKELPGILSWALEGCLDWQANGLNTPKEVLAATEIYRAEMDVISDFLSECCIVNTYARVKVSDLYKKYTDWCEENGEKPSNKRIFGERIRERGFNNNRIGHGGTWWWEGLGIIDGDLSGDQTTET